MNELTKFFAKHEHKTGPVGEFIRSCILVADLSQCCTLDELKETVQLDYLLECFEPLVDEDVMQRKDGEA